MTTERTEIRELKAQANRLRKASRFAEALPIYKSLWEETHDAFDGSGYLSCLRKLNKYDQALPLAVELFKEHRDFDWARKEVAWTLIQGRLLVAGEDASLVDITNIAKNIMKTAPDFLAKKMTVFTVLKHAKKHDDWACVAEWIDLLDPISLSDTPLKKEDRVDGWSDQERWYNYKINSCLENNNAAVALEICHNVGGNYPKHLKFFARLRALALRALRRTEESIAVYRDLCSIGKVDWWLLHEYGSVLAETDAIEEAMPLFCRAALSCPKTALAVKLYQEMGSVFFALEEKQTAFIHYSLAAVVRKENGWPVSPELEHLRMSLQSELCLQESSRSSGELLKLCRETWLAHLSDSILPSDYRKPREDLRGRISIVSGRRACFINCKDGLSAICMNEEVPPNIVDCEIVRFDAVPSFDKKRNRESWRAKNVQKII